MEPEDFVDLDSDTEVWLLDIGAYREWQISRFNGDGENQNKKVDKRWLIPLRKQVRQLQLQLNQEAQELPIVIRVRLFRYLRGESMGEIAQSEVPPVTRQAVQKCLKQALKTTSLRRARLIWTYKQTHAVTAKSQAQKVATSKRTAKSKQSRQKLS